MNHTLPIYWLLFLVMSISCADGTFSGVGKKDDDESEADEEEDQIADVPVQVSGAFLVCGSGQTSELGTSDDGQDVGCAAIDYKSKIKSTVCTSFDNVIATFADLSTEAVTLTTDAIPSYWQFSFHLQHKKILKTVSARSNCLVDDQSLQSRTVTFVPSSDGKDSESTKAQAIEILGNEAVPDKSGFDNTDWPATFRRLIFVTSEVYPSLFNPNDGATGNCYVAAKNAGLVGKFVALISDASGSAAAKSLADGIIYNTRNELVALSGELFNGSLANPVAFDEFGNPVYHQVWTGSKSDGDSAGKDINTASCQEWQSDTEIYKARIGRPEATDGKWLDANETDCDDTAGLYCISM